MAFQVVNAGSYIGRQKELRNRAIEAWRFIVAIIICIYHMKYYDPNLGYLPFRGGYLGNIFFFVLGGFLLMQHFERVTPPPPRGAEKCAAQYFWKKYIQFFPHHCFSWLLIAGVRIYCGMNTFKEIIRDGIWEFFLIQETGLGGQFRVNNTIWYLSAFLIASFLIYYLLLKNKEAFLYLIGPVSIFIILAYFYHDLGFLGYANQYRFPFCTGVWEAFAGLGYGCICYKIFEFIKKRKKLFKQAKIRIFTTLFELCGFGFFFYYCWYGITAKDFFIQFLLGFLIISIFTESSYITHLLNNKLSFYLGKITFAIFLNQFIFIHLMQSKFLGYPFWPMAICMLILIILFSAFSTWFIAKIVRNIKWFYVNYLNSRDILNT